MGNQSIYVISQGDGLKSHLSTEPEGDLAICGREINHYNKRVRKLKKNDMLLPFIICQRCLKAVGLED